MNCHAGPDQEHDRGVTIEAIQDPLRLRAAQVLLDGERVDVAQAPEVEVAGGGVMDRVGLPPVVVGHQGEDAEHGADDVVELLGPEEGAVAAVVLEHEEADHHEGGRHGQQEREPVADVEAPEHREPEGGEQRRRGDELEQALPHDGAAVWGEHGVPVDRLGRTWFPARRFPGSSVFLGHWVGPVKIAGPWEPGPEGRSSGEPGTGNTDGNDARHSPLPRGSQASAGGGRPPRRCRPPAPVP